MLERFLTRRELLLEHGILRIFGTESIPDEREPVQCLLPSNVTVPNLRDGGLLSGNPYGTGVIVKYIHAMTRKTWFKLSPCAHGGDMPIFAGIIAISIRG